MINLNAISKKLGDKTVLNNLNLDVSAGTIQAILGANGAGKSTLINILANLMIADGGLVFIDNEPITKNSFLYKKKIGFVFETPIYLEDFSGIEFLEFVVGMYNIKNQVPRKKIIDLLTLLGINNEANLSIKKYSKGQKAKISIAAALIHSPKILILDEPFDGLDFLSVQALINLLKLFVRNQGTIIITSHQYDIIAELCDKFALLKNGEIVFNKTMKELQNEAILNYSSSVYPVKALIEFEMTK